MAISDTTPTSVPPVQSGRQFDPDAYDVCRPSTLPPEHESDSERLDRIQHEFDVFRDCVNAELKVRAESSLLTSIVVKVVLPFAAIAAGFSAIYIAMLRAGESQSTHPELIFAAGYVVIASGAILLWRSLRRPGRGGRGDVIDQSIRNILRLTVPPSKAKLTRNDPVNRWVLFWLTWGLVIGLPIIFFIFRGNALDRAGLHLTFDTANVCAPTVGGFNPYEGSDVCKNRGYTYVSSQDVATAATTGVGTENLPETLSVVPPRSLAEITAANVRIDVTTTLVVYFLILIAGIVVNMIRWQLQRSHES